MVNLLRIFPYVRNLESMAYFDPVTGLPNRRAFLDEIRKRWTEAERYNSGMHLSVAFADIDYFREYNKRHGHSHGDSVLCDVGGAMKSVMREADMLARYGGEELAGIMVRADKETGLYIAERMRSAVENLGGITVTIGIASLPEDNPESPYELVNMADYAMNRGKREGRNRVVAYTRGLKPQTSPSI